MAIVTRKMKPEDMEAVVDLLSTWNMAPIQPRADVPDPRRSSIAIEHSFVAVDGARVVGVSSYFLLSEDCAETQNLAVHSDYRGKGVGYDLQRARLREMKERGITRVRTETDRPETISWYVEKFGYRIVGQSKKKHAFSLLDVDHWTVLELDLENYEM
jgi:3-keto-5-aminohexanoate cleavage enzyme